MPDRTGSDTFIDLDLVMLALQSSLVCRLIEVLQNIWQLCLDARSAPGRRLCPSLMLAPVWMSVCDAAARCRASPRPGLTQWAVLQEYLDRSQLDVKKVDAFVELHIEQV